MARRRFRRRKARPTKWGGFNRLNFLQGTTQTETVIWDPAVELIEAMGNPLLLLIRGSLSVRAAAGTSPVADVVSMYIRAFETDETQTVGTGAPPDPAANDAQHNEKRLLWNYIMQTPKGDGLAQEIEIDLRLKVILRPARALLFVTSHTDNTNQCRISGSLRTLVAID